MPREARFEDEFALLADEARMTRGVLFSSNVETGVAVQDEKVKELLAEGLKVASVTVPRGGGGVGGLFTNNFFRSSSWRKLLALDNEGRLKAIRDPETRRRLVDEIKSKDDGDRTKRWFWMGNEDRPRYSHALNESLYDMAQAAGGTSS